MYLLLRRTILYNICNPCTFYSIWYWSDLYRSPWKYCILASHYLSGWVLSGWSAVKKLRRATHTAAVCKFRGVEIFCSILVQYSVYYLVQYLIWFDLIWFDKSTSVAQLSSAFPYLSCFPNAADMLPLSSYSTSITSSTM